MKKDNGYVVRNVKQYDRLRAMDRELLFEFLNNTQLEAVDILQKVYKDHLEETLVNYINFRNDKKGKQSDFFTKTWYKNF